jgi:hypothetical protein
VSRDDVRITEEGFPVTVTVATLRLASRAS